MRFHLLCLYFRLWCYCHPRTMARLTNDKRLVALVKYFILDEPEHAVFFVKEITQFDEAQLVQLEQAVWAKELRKSPLRSMSVRSQHSYPARYKEQHEQ